MSKEVDTLLEQLAGRAGMVSQEDFLNMSGAPLGGVLLTMDSLSPEFVQSLRDAEAHEHHEDAPKSCAKCLTMTRRDLLD